MKKKFVKAQSSRIKTMFLNKLSLRLFEIIQECMLSLCKQIWYTQDPNGKLVKLNCLILIIRLNDQITDLLIIIHSHCQMYKIHIFFYRKKFQLLNISFCNTDYFDISYLFYFFVCLIVLEFEY